MIRADWWWLSTTPAYPPQLNPVPSSGVAPSVATTQPASTVTQHLAATGFPVVDVLLVVAFVCGVGLMCMLAGRR